VPWLGRELPAGPFAADDGDPDPGLLRALDAVAADPATEADVVAALARARVFVPVVAMTGEAAHLALITVTRPDGRRAMPVFSSVAALTHWRPESRPVPVPGPQAAQAAVAEGCDLLDLDPAGPVSYLVRRPAVWSLGRGDEWTPSYADQGLAEEVAAICAAEGLRSRCEPGTGAELRVVIGPPAGLAGPDLDQMIARVSRRLAASERFTAGVDSLEISVARLAP
jgi:SseB protein N-terminal domain